MDVGNASTAELFLSMQELIKEIDRRRVEVDSKLQYFDKKISNAYHEIETTSYDVFRGYNATKKLQRQLRFRRIVKNEMWIFNAIKHNSEDNNDKEWNRMIHYINNIIKNGQVSDKTLKHQREWSNTDKMGEIPYGELELEYNKKFGSLDDSLLRLRRVSGGSNDR